jgi:serine protease
MPHQRQTSFYSSLTLSGVAVLVATVLIAPPASATQNAPAPFPAPKPSPAAQGPARTAIPTDQFIVKFKNPAVPAERVKAFGPAAARLGTQVMDVRAAVGGARVLRTGRKLGAADAAKLLAALRADTAVDCRPRPPCRMIPVRPTCGTCSRNRPECA